MVATMIRRTTSVSVARNAGVRIRITRPGNGMPAASISDDQKTTLKGWFARKLRCAWRRSMTFALPRREGPRECGGSVRRSLRAVLAGGHAGELTNKPNRPLCIGADHAL